MLIPVLVGKTKFLRLLELLKSPQGLTRLEQHLAGALLAAHAAMGVACLMAIMDTSFKYKIMLLEVVFFGGDAVDAYMTGYKTGALIFATGLALVAILS